MASNVSKDISDAVCFRLKKDYPKAEIGDLFFVDNRSNYIENTKGAMFPIDEVNEEWFKLEWKQDRKID